MTTFYAQYPANGVGSTTVQTIQGEGTPGVQTGGLLTIQGDPSGTPIPISGSITATNPSVAATGASVPADATYIGMNVSGNLSGLSGNSNGLFTVINSALPAGSAIVGKFGIDQSTPGTTNGVQLTGIGTPGSPAGGVVSIQGVPGGTVVPVSGSVTATVASVGATGSAVPASADYIGLSNAGTLIGAVGDSSGRTVIVGAGTAGSGVGGIVTIQGNASGTAVPVTVSSLSPTTPTTAIFQAEGSLASTSLTSSYQTVFTPSSNTKILYMRNNTDVSVTVSMDGGTTINWILDSGDQVSVDLQSNAMVCTTTAIQIKAAGAGSTGNFRVNGVHT